MTATVTGSPGSAPGEPRGHGPARGRRPAGFRLQPQEVLLAGLVLLVVLRPAVRHLVGGEAAQTFFTVLVSIVLQALPFLVLGVLVSGAVAAFVPPEVLTRALPRNRAAAVPVAGLAGVLLPGCECGSVPVAGRLMGAGVPVPAALAFLLAAPAINPVVLVSTAVAFGGRPEWVLARFVASLTTAVVVGWVWTRVGDERIRVPAREHGGTPRQVFLATAQHDFLHAGGFLVLGGVAAAVLNVLVPRDVVGAAAGNAVVSVGVLALLAVVMSICSEADAFVAASLTEFSATARLAFLVVGPMVDLKLIALQAGAFGRGFTARFAPLTVLVALPVSTAVAAVLL